MTVFNPAPDQIITLTGGVTGSGTGSFAATVITNANLTGPITSVGNATTIADAELAALASLVSATDQLPYFTGLGTATLTTLTSAARSVLDDTTVSDMRTTLGLGSFATISTLAHSALTGLASDDHTQYALLAGRASGQTLAGGTTSGGNLTLCSTAHATRGKIILSATSAFDEANDRLGLGTASPSETLDLNAGTLTTKQASVLEIRLKNTGVVFKNIYTGGGWARGFFTYTDSADAVYTSIGGYGSGQVFIYGYLGNAYNDAAIKWVSADNKVGLGLTSNTEPSAKFHMGGGVTTATAWGLTGISFRNASGTFTNTTSSGVVANQVTNSFASPILAATSSTTYTNSANVYIAGAPANGSNVTQTNPYSLWIAAGNIRLDPSVCIGATSPSAKLHVLATTEQLRLGYDTSNYMNATVSSVGICTFDAVGTGATSFSFSDRVYVGLPSSLNDFKLGSQAAITNTTGSYGGFSAQQTANPSSSSTATMYGAFFEVGVTSANAQNLTSARGLIGFASACVHRGTGTVTGYVAVLGASSSVTSSGTITNAYGFYASAQKQAHVTNGYGIYSEGGTDRNYFGGTLSVGTTDTPTAKFHAVSTTEQLRIGYDSTKYVSYTVSSIGGLTVASTGTNAGMTFSPSGTGNFKLSTGMLSVITTGTSAVAGNATLVAGAKAVTTDAVTANTLVLLTRKTSGGTIGMSITYTLQTTAPKGFTINSDNILDTSTFSWLLVEGF